MRGSSVVKFFWSRRMMGMVLSASTTVLADSTIYQSDDAFCEEDGVCEGDGF